MQLISSLRQLKGNIISWMWHSQLSQQNKLEITKDNMHIEVQCWSTSEVIMLHSMRFSLKISCSWRVITLSAEFRKPRKQLCPYTLMNQMKVFQHVLICIWAMANGCMSYTHPIRIVKSKSANCTALNVRKKYRQEAQYWRMNIPVR